MCHGPFSLMDPVNPVLPGEGRWLTGDASARVTGMQLDPMQARLDEVEGVRKSGIPGKDSSSNTSSSQRRHTRSCLVDN